MTQREDPAKKHLIPSISHTTQINRPSATSTSVISHTTVQRAQANPRALSPNDITHLQRTIGNQAVQRLLNTQAMPALQRNTQAGFEAGDEFEQQLSRSQGRGAPYPKRQKLNLNNRWAPTSAACVSIPMLHPTN